MQGILSSSGQYPIVPVGLTERGNMSIGTTPQRQELSLPNETERVNINSLVITLTSDKTAYAVGDGISLSGSTFNSTNLL
ncbi:MAG: hypothetical protein WBX01_07485 [Nitrososphaeraceae archaeon]